MRTEDKIQGKIKEKKNQDNQKQEKMHQREKEHNGKDQVYGLKQEWQKF